MQQRPSHSCARMPGQHQCTNALGNKSAGSTQTTQTLQEAHLGTPSKVVQCGAPNGNQKTPTRAEAKHNTNTARGPPRCTLAGCVVRRANSGKQKHVPEHPLAFVRTHAPKGANPGSTAKRKETPRGPPRNALGDCVLQRTTQHIHASVWRPRKADKTIMRARSKSPRRSASQALEAVYRCSNAARFSTATRQGVPHSNSTEV